MWLNKVTEYFNRIIRPISGVLYGIGLGVLVALMFLTMSDVILRYVFNRPITGSFDLTEFMMAVIIVFGVAHCGFTRGHVKVELVMERMPAGVQVIAEIVTSLLGLGLFSLITWQCFVYTKVQFDSGVASNILEIPVFPFVGIVGLGSAVYTVVLLLHFLESLAQAVNR
jgi:TRAP-type C4-dicarboxylate transport system permease small subunit